MDAIRRQDGPTWFNGGEIGAGSVRDVQQVGALQVRQQAQAGVGAGGDARPPHPLAPLRQGEHAITLRQQPARTKTQNPKKQPARAAWPQILDPTGAKQTKKSLTVLGTATCDRVCRQPNLGERGCNAWAESSLERTLRQAASGPSRTR